MIQSNSEGTESPQTIQDLDSLIVPSQYNSESPSNIDWPRIGNPAIVLNGSEIELRVKGPANISSWDIELYREYIEYTLVLESPTRNTSTGVWHINARIPSNALVNLYDLRMSISDGVSNYDLVEKNAVQIRNAFPDDLRIVHITDTHINSGMPDRDTKLLSVLYQAGAAGADLIIISGDLVQNGGFGPFNRFYNLISQSSVPIYVVPGNHDHDPNLNFAPYVAVFGDDYYTVNIGPDIFMTMANSHLGELNSTQIGWIERDMAASSAQTKILSFHYSGQNLLLNFEEELLELSRICNETNVDVVLTGHSHIDRVDESNGTLWIITTGLGPDMSFGGHGRNGFRVVDFQDGTPTYWNWTINQPWSQPWDSVTIDRQPTNARNIDVGAYLSITNNLNYSVANQIWEFLVQPISGGRYYIVSGANVLSTINGTDAFLIRVGFDLDAGESKTIRIFPDDATAPSISYIEYPLSVHIEEEYVISVNLTNPSSGILDVQVDVDMDGELLDRYTMMSSGGMEWRITLEHNASGEIEFQIFAFDYSGLEFSSPIYAIDVVPAVQPLEMLLIILVSVGVIGVVVVAFYIIRRK